MVHSRRKILVAMSGGVDSSVAAAVLRQAGHQVIGVFMRMGIEQDDFGLPIAHRSMGGNSHPDGRIQDCQSAVRSRTCCSAADAGDARAVAARLAIPFYVLNFADDFDRMIDRFVAEYNRGRTPNPCIRCNSELKFGRLVEYADAIGADGVATGHYARIVPTAGGPRLARGADQAKDQSYVLFALPRRLLDRVVLPLGEWTKQQVRARAAELGLPVADKPDSQEICFVPDDDYADLVVRRSPGAVRPGPVLDLAGRVIGTHPGHQHYTIGQRRGLGIAAGQPIYVVGIDPRANAVTVGPADALLRGDLTCSDVNWLAADCASAAAPQGCGQDASLRARVKIRYRAPAAAAAVFPLPPDRARVVFDEPVSAVTPGQAAVFYDDAGLVLGGGWID